MAALVWHSQETSADLSEWLRTNYGWPPNSERVPGRRVLCVSQCHRLVSAPFAPENRPQLGSSLSSQTYFTVAPNGDVSGIGDDSSTYPLHVLASPAAMGTGCHGAFGRGDDRPNRQWPTRMILSAG